MMSLVRRGKRKVRGSGFTVTWDVDSRDRTAANRLQFFLFGRVFRRNRKEYRYEGFVWKEGVRYLAQSAVFVLPHRLEEIQSLLRKLGVEHDVARSAYP